MDVIQNWAFQIRLYIGKCSQATVLMNGYSQEITSNTNTVTFNGLTMNLSSAGFTTVTVSADKDKIVQKQRIL